MRRINMETAVIKLLIFASSLILTCILITIGVVNFRQSRQLAGMTAGRISEYTLNFMQADIMNYDGLIVRGSDVINFYKKHMNSVKAGKEGEFYITVNTAAGSNTYKDGSFLDRMKDNADICYIKPTSRFKGIVEKNENGVITKVIFNQE